MSAHIASWLVPLVTVFAVTVSPSPLCQTPQGADAAWLAAQGEGNRFGLPPYASWTADYPGYSAALGFLGELSDKGVLGIYTDHHLESIGVVVDSALADTSVDQLKSKIESGLPTGAPSVELHRTCFPLARTVGVVGRLVDGSWHPDLSTSTDWSVLAWPQMGGFVEVWIEEPLDDIDRHLGGVLGDDVELVRLVTGDDLAKGWAGTRAVESSLEPTSTTTTPPPPDTTSASTPTTIETPVTPPDSSGVPGALWATIGVVAVGGGVWLRRRRG